MITYVPSFSLDSPAAIDHDGRCNRVYVNPLTWWLLPRGQRDFITAHELAHCEHDVFDELHADRLGFQSFIGQGGDPQDALDAIQNNLDLSQQEPQYRFNVMQARVKDMQAGHPVSYFSGGAPGPRRGWIGIALALVILYILFNSI